MSTEGFNPEVFELLMSELRSSAEEANDADSKYRTDRHLVGAMLGNLVRQKVVLSGVKIDSRKVAFMHRDEAGEWVRKEIHTNFRSHNHLEREELDSEEVYIQKVDHKGIWVSREQPPLLELLVELDSIEVETVVTQTADAI